VNGGPPAVASGDSNPALTLLRGAALPALAALAGLALAALVIGADEAASVLVGGALAISALTAVALLQQFCRNVDPSLVLGIAVLVYCTTIGALGYAYSLVNDASWLIGGFAAGGVLTVAVAWTIGHLRAAVKLRQPLYQEQETTAGR